MVSTQARLRLDPWPAEYESAVPFDSFEPEAAAEVDATVEMTDWRGVAPPVAPPPSRRVCFVDGVRRIEARVLLEQEDRLVHGLFGSTAAGSVASESAQARFGGITVGRYLILGAGESRRERICVGPLELEFAARSTADNTPAGLVGVLQNLMRTDEATVAEALAGEGSAVFVDGPLAYLSTTRHEIVGVVKRIQRPYLPAWAFAVLSALRPGERTPLFAIHDGQTDRYSWFLRVSGGRLIDHPLAGLLRLEVRAAVGLEAALRLAAESSFHLPRFASSAARDPRSPQNLLPVGALEEEMRRRFGDPVSIRRGIERRLHEEVSR